MRRLYNQTPKRTRFDLLLAEKAVSPEDLAEARVEARRQGVSIERVLMEQHKVPKELIGKSLSSFFGHPFQAFDEARVIPPAAVKGIRPDYMRMHFWVPLKVEKDAVEVLTDNPVSQDRLRYIRRFFPKQKLKLYVGLKEDVHRFIESVGFEAGPQAKRRDMEDLIKELREKDVEQEAEAKAVDENYSAIVALADRIILDAVKEGVSDIHIEPNSTDKETVIRFRIEGDCHEYKKVPASCRRALVSRFKIMAGMDISVHNRPQDGKIKFRMPKRKVELRVATIPTAGPGNEDVVMRVLAASEPIPLEKMKFSGRNLREIHNLLEKPYGMFLCVGPTGSGKTTTLHSALGYLNEPCTKIWTAEDPVEITQYGLRQVQINRKQGLDFAAVMRAFLRADPDVIMVGEMRDKETAAMGIEASLTGHLVLSTLHTNSAPETVVRLLAMGMDPFNFADSLLGVLAQRLVRRVCNRCRQKYHPAKQEYQALAHAYGEKEFAALGVPYDKKFQLCRGKGCEACKGTGYKGRVALHELLVSTDEIRELIQKGATADEIAEVSAGQGMTSLLQDGIVKVLVGLTDYKQVQAAAMK